MIKVNGKEIDIKEISLEEYLKDSKYDLKRVAVELNGEIVPKSIYNQVILKDGDHIEVVSFVGGGWYDSKQRTDAKGIMREAWC